MKTYDQKLFFKNPYFKVRSGTNGLKKKKNKSDRTTDCIKG